MTAKKRFATLAILISASASFIIAQSSTRAGTVIETMNSGGYSYINIAEDTATFWIAAPRTAVDSGATVRFTEGLWMADFASPSLKRTFDRIMFVGKIEVVPTHTKPARTGPVEDAGVFTIAEVFAQRAQLHGKRITIEGKVVKVSEHIMSRNWVHLQDGTGAEGAAKIIFTSPGDKAEVGSQVTASGILAVDKDFGSGYFYTVIVEESSFTK